MLYNLFENRDFVSVFAVALLAEGVDRNQTLLLLLVFGERSPSSRRAWIEIARSKYSWVTVKVALLAEGVDRNPQRLPSRRREAVALLAEGVDRNQLLMRCDQCGCESPSSRRAWIEITHPRNRRKGQMSPSSRRAWIEIACKHGKCLCVTSPSSRRAWIEITFWGGSFLAKRSRPPRGGRG